MKRLEEYLNIKTVSELIATLDIPNPALLKEEIHHFSEREVDQRDKIVQNYFGEEDITRITNAFVETFLSSSSLPENPQVLDVGAGSGFFTVRVKEKFQQRVPQASFYAMDLTPAMLRNLAKKNADIVPFLGAAEDLSGSLSFARNYLEMPSNFDIIFSTLTLHHCKAIEPVFQSFKEVLSPKGMVVLLDLCKHQFEEFQEEMGDIHLGFDVDKLKRIAESKFSFVKLEQMPGICCTSSGRSAELFLLSLKRLT